MGQWPGKPQTAWTVRRMALREQPMGVPGGPAVGLRRFEAADSTACAVLQLTNGFELVDDRTRHYVPTPAMGPCPHGPRTDRRHVDKVVGRTLVMGPQPGRRRTTPHPRWPMQPGLLMRRDRGGCGQATRPAHPRIHRRAGQHALPTRRRQPPRPRRPDRRTNPLAPSRLTGTVPSSHARTDQGRSCAPRRPAEDHRPDAHAYLPLTPNSPVAGPKRPTAGRSAHSS